MTDFHLLQARFWFLTDNRIKINVAQPPIKKKNDVASWIYFKC